MDKFFVVVLVVIGVWLWGFTQLNLKHPFTLKKFFSVLGISICAISFGFGVVDSNEMQSKGYSGCIRSSIASYLSVGHFLACEITGVRFVSEEDKNPNAEKLREIKLSH